MVGALKCLTIGFYYWGSWSFCTPTVDSNLGCLHSREEGFVFNWLGDPRTSDYLATQCPKASDEVSKRDRGAQCGYWRKLIEITFATSLGQGRTHSWDELGGNRNQRHSNLSMQYNRNRPWSTTLQAWWRRPFSDFSPFHLQKRFCDQTSTSTAIILSNISCGSTYLQGYWA